MKNNAFRLFAVVFFLPFMHACHQKSVAKSTNTATVTNTDLKKVVINPEVDIKDIGSAYVIDSVSITGKVLSLFVNYSGGCKEHNFELISTGMYLKSLPPQIAVCLKHTNNEDMCRKLIFQELKFDISALKYKGNENTVVIVGDKKINFF